MGQESKMYVSLNGNMNQKHQFKRKICFADPKFHWYIWQLGNDLGMDRKLPFSFPKLKYEEWLYYMCVCKYVCRES